MAYERQYYTNGDVLDARQMNHMETGIKENSDNIDKLSEDIATKASAIKEKASGEVIVVTDSAEAKPLGLAIDGKSEQNQYSGKNTLDCSGLSTYVNRGVTFTPVYKDNGELEYILANGTNDGTGESRLIISGEPSSLKDNQSLGEVVLSGCPSGGGASTYRIVAYAYPNGTSDAQKTLADYGNGADSNSKKDWSTVDKYYSAIFVSRGVTVNNLKFYPMLRLASIANDTYEPFVGGKPSPSTEYEQKIRNTGKYDEASGKYAVEVKCTKKNLFDKNAPFIGGYYFDENDNPLTTSDMKWGIHDQYIKVIPNEDYTVSGNLVPLNWSLGVAFYDVNKNTIKSKGYSNKDGKVTFNTPEDTRYIRFSGYKTNETTFDTVQFELGTVATDYEPFQETTATVLLPQPLRKGDKAYWNGGSKVRIDRYRDIEVFDGSDDEKIGYDASAGRLVCENIANVIDKSKIGSEIAEILCDKMVACSLSDIYAGKEGISVSESGNISMRVNALTSLADWKAHLAENPFTLEYPLATPITEEIDIDLGELSMFYPTTILSNDCNANMEVTYIADTKAYIDKKFAELATAMV